MATDPASLFTIDGTVLGPGGDPRPGVRLVAVDVVDDQPNVLVFATSDGSGRFSTHGRATARIGIDVNAGPLAQARRTLNATGVSGVELRLSYERAH